MFLDGLVLSVVSLAAIAQLGERQTEDLKVPGSIPGGGKFFFVLVVSTWGKVKKSDTFSICACHPCAGAMLIFSVSFQFLRMTPKGSSVLV